MARALLMGLATAAALAAGGAAAAEAGPAPAKDEAVVRSAFPGTERVEVRDVLLTDPMVERIERLARARVKERLVTFYTARRGGEVLGYAVIHSHVVRTKRETLLLAFEPDGRIRKVTVLAFLEPQEYRPPERWLRQLEGKGPADRLAVGDDLAPITGATLSARGIAEESRWLLQALRETAGARP
ncbi:FMN-binding protein [Anaeromyxobacter sp. PSR-1]|uniref:FMN-binding protein n=1 Tax=unclassified Anaeromyxobacter TaxID=2620896 RepID=UPI0005E15EF8|nr:FMN-binding protein [Anaeromyxobacter sp. PSR-1]GAO03461.1 hypothetical protein PSR1_02345 [Anaeromyxobacter sp. PSR-1]